MCIIVAKPAGIEFPPQETLENCFTSNPDGAGFMFARDKRVFIRKGFMDFASFIDALIEADIDASEACVMHFRIGTQGGNTPQNCHPFPVPCDEDSIKALECEAPIGMAHNGIISLFSQATGSLSDTMLFSLRIVDPMFRLAPSFMQSDDALSMLENTCKSKLCFLDGLGDIVTVGDFIDESGCLYSNTGYLSHAYGFSTYKTIWSEDEPYGLFDACEWCSEHDECKWFGPICRSEEEALSSVGIPAMQEPYGLM